MALGADTDPGVDGDGLGEDGEEASEDEDTNMAMGVDGNGAGDIDKECSWIETEDMDENKMVPFGVNASPASAGAAEP